MYLYYFYISTTYKLYNVYDNNNNDNNQQDNVTYSMVEIKSITFQFNKSIFELSEVTASIIKYTSILITVCKN